MSEILHGDCREIMAAMPPESIDAIVCDPPYELGFMGKKWDSTGVAFSAATWEHALRVLKPGGHLVAFGGTRTYHRLACAIEDAGFEIRDCVFWTFGSGFPKSLDVSKAVDKAAGAERELTRPGVVERAGYGEDWDTGSSETRPRYDKPATDAARQWQGWGTALKPAVEPCVLARRPLIGTVAENVLEHGTGAINVDGCRVEAAPNDPVKFFNRAPGTVSREQWRKGTTVGPAKHADHGRWPANLVHDGSDEVLACFPETGAAKSGGRSTGRNFGQEADDGFVKDRARTGHDDAGGSAARFFASFPHEDAQRFKYCPKASKRDRCGSKHPTVKPIALMRWLCRLVTPPGGIVLDPFAGSGTTGEAARLEGFEAILIEREDEYVADIRRRLAQPIPSKQEAFI